MTKAVLTLTFLTALSGLQAIAEVMTLHREKG